MAADLFDPKRPGRFYLQHPEELETLADEVWEAGNVHLPVHRAVVALHSSFFRKAYLQATEDAKENEAANQERALKRAKVDFSFDGFSAGGVATFLRYLYNSEAQLPAACDALLPRLRSAVRLTRKVNAELVLCKLQRALIEATGPMPDPPHPAQPKLPPLKELVATLQLADELELEGLLAHAVHAVARRLCSGPSSGSSADHPAAGPPSTPGSPTKQQQAPGSPSAALAAAARLAEERQLRVGALREAVQLRGLPQHTLALLLGAVAGSLRSSPLNERSRITRQHMPPAHGFYLATCDAGDLMQQLGLGHQCGFGAACRRPDCFNCAAEAARAVAVQLGSVSSPAEATDGWDAAFLDAVELQNGKDGRDGKDGHLSTASSAVLALGALAVAVRRSGAQLQVAAPEQIGRWARLRARGGHTWEVPIVPWELPLGGSATASTCFEACGRQWVLECGVEEGRGKGSTAAVCSAASCCLSLKPAEGEPAGPALVRFTLLQGSCSQVVHLEGVGSVAGSQAAVPGSGRLPGNGAAAALVRLGIPRAAAAQPLAVKVELLC